MKLPDDLLNSFPTGCAIGFASNGGTKRYLIEAESTTGFTAWRLDDGTILINPAETVGLPASPSVTFWPCVGYQDSTPAGDIVSLDCHANELTSLKVGRLKKLRFLDCCYNRLQELDLADLIELEVLDADNNELAGLDVHDLHSLRILNCANNHLEKLDLSGLSNLQILDCADNPLKWVKTDGCAALSSPKTRESP